MTNCLTIEPTVQANKSGNGPAVTADLALPLTPTKNAVLDVTPNGGGKKRSSPDTKDENEPDTKKALVSPEEDSTMNEESHGQEAKGLVAVETAKEATTTTTKTDENLAADTVPGPTLSSSPQKSMNQDDLPKDVGPESSNKAESQAVAEPDKEPAQAPEIAANNKATKTSTKEEATGADPEPSKKTESHSGAEAATKTAAKEEAAQVPAKVMEKQAEDEAAAADSTANSKGKKDEEVKEQPEADEALPKETSSASETAAPGPSTAVPVCDNSVTATA